jgi:carbonic anhydrase/acetyltransferase-like protein (isoleucine patch superfamily)
MTRTVMTYTFKKWTPVLGEKTWIAPSADVVGNVTLGKDVSIWFGCVVRGDVHHISIGDRSNIQDLTMKKKGSKTPKRKKEKKR